MGDLAPDEEQVKNAQDEIEAGETNQCEQDGAAIDNRAGALTCPEQAEDQPRLAAELRRHPPRSRGDVRKREGEHEHPEHPSVLHQSIAQLGGGGQQRECDHDGAEAGHHVERVVEEFDVIGPDVLRKLVEARHVAVECPVGKKTEDAWNDDRIVETPLATMKFPEPVDIVFTSENYHDFQNMGMFLTDTAAMDKAAFAALKPGGFLTRDPRAVERKKYGRPKARRTFQFSKR